MEKLTPILFFLGFFNLALNAQLICFDFPADTFATQGFPTSITAADYNGDGFDDLAVCHYDGEFFSIMLNDGAGNFPESVKYSLDFGTYWSTARKIVAAKINNDDIIDLAIIGYYDFIYMGNGDGTFYKSTTIDLGCNSEDAVAGYFNQDEFIDLAIIHDDNSTMSILFGEYTGTFQEMHIYYVMGRTPKRIANGDFNEDGITDLVVCNYGLPNGLETGLVLFVGNALGAFQPFVISQENYPESVAVGDFNHDNHQDIIFKRYDRWLYKLWGNGDGTFQEPEVEDISAIYYAVYLHTVDIDSDSLPDLAMGGRYFNMHINDGSGMFADTLFINEKSNYKNVNELVIGNFNGDAKPDIVSTHHIGDDWTYGSLTVYLNCLPVDVPEKDNQEETVSLYPNPGNGHLRILTGHSPGKLELGGIFDCTGREVYEGDFSWSGQYLDLSSLNPGLYIIRFKCRNNIISKKVIIN